MSEFPPLAVVFTGSRSWLPRHLPDLIQTTRAVLPRVTDYQLSIITGMQYGLDTAAADWCYGQWPDAQHYLVQPAAPCNTALPNLLPGAQVVRVAKGASNAESYRLRDDTMLQLAVAKAGGPSRVLCLAYPLGSEGSRRYSGTWVTVRKARKLEVPTHVHQLEP